MRTVYYLTRNGQLQATDYNPYRLMEQSREFTQDRRSWAMGVLFDDNETVEFAGESIGTIDPR